MMSTPVLTGSAVLLAICKAESTSPLSPWGMSRGLTTGDVKDKRELAAAHPPTCLVAGFQIVGLILFLKMYLDQHHYAKMTPERQVKCNHQLKRLIPRSCPKLDS